MIRLIPVLALLVGCDTIDPTLTNDTDKLMQGIYLLAFLALVLFGMGRSISVGKTLKYLAIWAILLIALVYAYSFRTELNTAYMRVKGELFPTLAQSNGNGEVTIRRDIDGHFSVRIYVNGTSETFLIDTGASSVVLPYRVADRLGYDPANLPFILQVGTANGQAVAAPITIARMEIEGIVIRDVSAMVVEQNKLSQPLLGMSFLNRLYGFSVSGNTMTLTQ